MWNAFRKLLKKSVGPRPPLAACRFAVEPLEDRLNLSHGAAAAGEFPVGGPGLLFESTPLASAIFDIFEEGNVTLQVRDRVLAADPVRRDPLDDFGSGYLDQSNAIRPTAPIFLEVVVVRQPRFQIIVPPTWTIVVAHHVGPPHRIGGTPAAIMPSGVRFGAVVPKNSPTGLRGESHLHAPPPDHKVQVGSLPEIAWSNLSAATGEEFAPAPSFSVETAATGPTTSIAAYSSREPLGTAASYGDEGGLIDIGGIGNQESSPAKTAIPGESIQARDGASDRSPQERSLMSLAPTDANSMSDDAGTHARALHESPPLRALADSGEGGMIDLAEVSTVHSERVAENSTAIASAERQPNSQLESTEAIQVDSSVGLFRAFELAIAPEGEMHEPTGASAVTLPDDDTSTETPVSTDVIEVDPAVSGAAAAIPAVLMVANWAQATRGKRRREQTAIM